MSYSRAPTAENGGFWPGNPWGYNDLTSVTNDFLQIGRDQR